MNMNEMEFKFRKPRESAIKEARESGNPVPVHRKPVTVAVPQYNAADLITILQSPSAEADFITGLVNSAVAESVRQHFADDTIYPVSAEILDLTNYNPQAFTLTELAKEPETQRSSEKVEITKEMLADFEKALTGWLMGAEQFAAMGAAQRQNLAGAIYSQVKSGFRAIAANAAQLGKIRKVLTVFAEEWLTHPANDEAPERDSVVDILTESDRKIRRLLRAIEKRAALFESMPEF